MSEPTIVILCDTREQAPWSFTLPTIRATVPTGADYSVQGFEHVIGIERKSLDDLVGSLTQGRERFMRSLAALRERKHRALIIEADMADIREHRYRSMTAPSSVIGSLASIWADGIPVFLAGDHMSAGQFAERLLIKFCKRAREAQAA